MFISGSHNTNASSPLHSPASPSLNRCQSPYTEVPIVTHRNYDTTSLSRGNSSVGNTPTKKFHTFAPPQVCTNSEQWHSTDKLIGKNNRPSVAQGDAGCHGYQNYEYSDGKNSVPDVVPGELSDGSTPTSKSGVSTNGFVQSVVV